MKQRVVWFGWWFPWHMDEKLQQCTCASFL